MEYDVLTDLRNLADKLDDNNFTKHADEVDSLIAKFADELGTGENVLTKSLNLGGRTEQIDERVRQQMSPENAGAQEPVPVEMPGLKGQQSRALSASEMSTEIDRNPMFKKAMLGKVQELASLYMDPNDRKALGQYIQQNEAALNGAQISQMLGQFGFLRPEK